MVKKYIYCEKKFFDLCMTKIANWYFISAIEVYSNSPKIPLFCFDIIPPLNNF